MDQLILCGFSYCDCGYGLHPYKFFVVEEESVALAFVASDEEPCILWQYRHRNKVLWEIQK